MIDATHTVTIDRPVDEVFDFVAESSNEPRWNVDVASSGSSGASWLPG